MIKKGILHDASYGSIIPVASLRKGEFDRCTKLFIEIPFVKQGSIMQMQEKQENIRALFTGKLGIKFSHAIKPSLIMQKNIS